MLGRLGLLMGATCALAACSGQSARPIEITGSSTVYPFTKAVADAYVQADDKRKPPTIAPIGTVAGIRQFCGGTGSKFPDIADASRRMRRAEFDKCQAAKVGEIVEITIGLDGIAFAESNVGSKLKLTRKDIYLALAANPMRKPNTARTWRDVNASLPAVPIRVLGPPASSGTRDALVQLLLEPGCLAADPDAAKLQSASDPALFANICQRIRGDGPYVEQGEDYTAIVRGVEQDPNALGLVGYSYLESSRARLHGVPIDGIAPDADAIASGKYAGLRSLYLYVKKSSLQAKPEIGEFLELYTGMTGPGGPLVKQGLIPLPDRARRNAAETAQFGFPLDPAVLP